MKKSIPLVARIQRGDSFEIDINLIKADIPNEKNVRIIPNKELHQVLKTANDTPFMLCGSEVQKLVATLQQALSYTTDALLHSPEALAILKQLYDIDFSALYENNKNKELVRDLITYGLSILSFFDKRLSVSSQNNLACENAYHILSSYKFYFIGFLNDALLYKDFKYFYIDKYLTNTGRMFPKTYFLQLQGHKLFRVVTLSAMATNAMEQLLHCQGSQPCRH